MDRETRRPGTRPDRSRTLALVLGLSLVLGGLTLVATADEGRAHVPETLYVNVADAANLGCSDDEPDFRVTVYHEGTRIGRTDEATHQARPVFGDLYRIDDPTYPLRLQFELEEGESALFSGHWYETCDLGQDGGERGEVVYDPAAFPEQQRGHGHTLSYHLSGNGEKAAQLRVTVGPTPPPRPVARVADVGAHEATVGWDGHPGTTHALYWGQKGRHIHSSDSGEAGTHRLTDLTDNTDHHVRVLRENGSWMVASQDLAFTTENVAPEPAWVRYSRYQDDGNVTVAWRSPTTHDVDRYEVHMSDRSDFDPGPDTLRKRVQPFADWEDQDAYGIEARSGDQYVMVRTVDTGGLSADSDPATLGWDYEDGSAHPPPQEPRDPPPEDPPRDSPPPPPDVRITHAQADRGRGGVWWEVHGPAHPVDRFEVHVGSTPDFATSDGTRVWDADRWERSASGYGVPEETHWVRVKATTPQGPTSVSPAYRVEQAPSHPPEVRIDSAVVVDRQLEVDWTVLHRGSGSATADVHVGPRPHFVPSASTLRATVELSRGHARTSVDGSDAYVMLVLHDRRHPAVQTEPVWIERHGPPELQVGLALHTGDQLVVEWRGQTPDGAKVTLHAEATPATASAGAEARATSTRMVGLNGWVRMEAPAQQDDRYVVLKATWAGGQYVTEPVALDLAAGVDQEPEPEPYEQERLEPTEVQGGARVQSGDDGVTVDTLVKIFGGGAGLGGVAAGVGAALRRRG